MALHLYQYVSVLLYYIISDNNLLRLGPPENVLRPIKQDILHLRYEVLFCQQTSSDLNKGQTNSWQVLALAWDLYNKTIWIRCS